MTFDHSICGGKTTSNVLKPKIVQQHVDSLLNDSLTIRVSGYLILKFKLIMPIVLMA